MAFLLSSLLLFGLLPMLISLSAASGPSQLPPPTGVKFIIVGFRHGNRNPGQFFKNDTSNSQWAWEGPSQLTTYGKRQAYSLGQFLRTRYDQLIPKEYVPSKNIRAYSSSAERCQQTLQAAMAGLYSASTNRSKWNPALNWQPVTYEINDPLLRMYNVKCPTYTSAYQGISEDTSAAANAWLNREPNLVAYIAQKTGFNKSLSDMGDAADNLANMKLFNVTMPDWVKRPTLTLPPPRTMYDAVTSFAEAHQILCANDSHCARIMSGLWLNQMLGVLKDKRDGKLPDRAANFYAAHTETVLSLIRLLKARDVAECPTSAGLILEFGDQPKPRVRFLFHEADPTNPDRRLAFVKRFEFCADDDWCDLDKFADNVKGPSFANWQQACNSTTCPI